MPHPFDWLTGRAYKARCTVVEPDGNGTDPDTADEGPYEPGPGLLNADLDLDLDSPPSSSSPSQPSTPHNDDIDRFTMPSTSPIDIATPTRNASSSPSSQGQKKLVFHDSDSRTSAMMAGTGYDSRGRQDSFAGAKPISMNIPNKHADNRPRRESLAGSLVGGMSWGGVSVGSWIRDE
jgi:transcription factor SFP1